MKYKLNVSYNCGSSYVVEKESDNLEELKKEGRKFDALTLRWDIQDEDGKQVECCAIHKGIVGFMERVRQREPLSEEENRRSKHELFVSCEELIRGEQERLLWWVESRNKAKGLLLWSLKSSPESFYSAFELLRDAYKEIAGCLKSLERVRRLQLDTWRIETTVRINLSVDRAES